LFSVIIIHTQQQYPQGVRYLLVAALCSGIALILFTSLVRHEIQPWFPTLDASPPSISSLKTA
jgi:hypothetical protein